MNRLLSLLAALVLAVPATVRATVAATDHPGSLAILAGSEDVQKALSLTSSQRHAIQTARESFRRDARAVVASAPATPEARAQADARLEALKQASNQRILSLLTPAQRAKLHRIEHRVLGSTLLVSPSVQQKLQLTDWQKRTIEKIRRKGVEFTGRVNRWYDNGEISYSERIDLLRDRRIRQARAMELLLSPAQRRMLESFRDYGASPT